VGFRRVAGDGELTSSVSAERRCSARTGGFRACRIGFCT
jgi:hypothetical protein